MATYTQNERIAFPRIYYREEELIGNPVDTKIINKGTFDAILQNACADYYISQEKYGLVLLNGDF